MLRRMKDLEGYTIGATDGIIGQVKDFYFDDDAWGIRYLVVEIGEGLPRRRVLVSPIAIGQPNWSKRILPASITRSQIYKSPDIDTDKPVSRQQEEAYFGYYGWGTYWGGGGLWGAGMYPEGLQAGLQVKGSNTSTHSGQAQKAASGNDSKATLHQHDDPHLRSGNAVMRYYVHGTDGDIGHVAGLLVDEKSWGILYIIVNTSNWWLGHEVLIAPESIGSVDWSECKVFVDLTREAIKGSPPYDAATLLDPAKETEIHALYGRAGYKLRAAQHAAASESRL